MMITKVTLVTGGILGLLSCAALAQSANVSDQNVEDAIRAEIGKNSGDLTLEDLAKVEKLDLSGLDLSKVTIPDGLINMEELDLSRNILSPSLFNPVRFPDDMENLKILNLGSNRLPNLGPIEHLSSVEVLNVSDNGFTEIEIPDSLKTNLRELNLGFNELESIVIQEGFENLEVLNLERNGLVGSLFTGPVSFPSDLTKLRILDLSHNELSTLNVPPGLLSLEELHLEENGLGSINFGGPLPSIIEIIAFRNNLKTLTLPEGMANLQTLDLFENSITELTIQDGLNTEPFIDLAGNPIERFIVPEGTHEDLITYFERWDEAEIVFIPTPLPNLVDIKILPTGSFEMVLAGPTGTYAVFRSTDLMAWNEVDTVINEIGEVAFTTSIASHPGAYFRIERIEEEPEEE